MQVTRPILLVLFAGCLSGCGSTRLPDSTAQSTRVAGLGAALDPQVQVVTPLTSVRSPEGLGLQVQPVDDGGTVLLLFSAPNGGALVDPVTPESLVTPPQGLLSYVDGAGHLTSFATPASLLHAANNVFGTTPYSTAVKGGALVALCASGNTGASTSYYYVDTSGPSLQEVTGLPADSLCVLSSDMPLVRIGRGHEPGTVIVGNRLYAIRDGVAESLTSFVTPTPTTASAYYHAVAWVEEIEPGVFADVIVSFSMLLK